jgi:hypothetical protein
VSAPSDSREREAEAVAHEVSRVEAAPEADGPGDALSQLASRWSVEIATMSGEMATGIGSDGVGVESVRAGGAPAMDPHGVTAQRQTPPGGDKAEDKSARFKTMPDGSKLEIHADGSGSFFLRGPGGEKVPCDEGGEPTPGAEDKLAAEVAEDEEEEEEEVCEEEEEEQTEEEACEEEDAEKEEEGEGKEVPADEAGGDAVPVAAPGGGPAGFPALSEGPLAPYVHEKSWHEGWAASGSQEGDLSTMDGGDKGSLVLNALGSGAAEGLVNGAQALIIDTILNKATKRIPYASGFIGAAEILKDPGAWWAGSFADPFGDLGELWAGDWIDKLEAVVSVLDMVNTVVGTLSTVCLVVAGAGFIASLFFPALLPFVALAAKWGLLLGEISSLAGLVIDVVRAALIAARTAQILVSDADPAVQAKRAERLQAQTNKWVSSSTARAGNSLGRKGGNKGDGADAPKTGTPKAGSGGPDATSTRKSWKSKMNDAFNPVQQIKNQKRATFGGTDAQGNHTKGAWAETREMTGAYKNTKGKPVSDRLTAMQDVGGDAPIVSDQSKKRAADYDQAKASQKAQPTTKKTTKTTTTHEPSETPEQMKKRVKDNIAASKKARESNNEGNGLADHSADGITSRSLEPAEIRKQAMSADFWDPKNTANRKAMRKGIEAKAARETNPQKKAALLKVADDMVINERILKEHLNGRQEGADDTGAVARVTQESKLNDYGTAGPRGIQNVAKAKDVAGITSANEMGDKLGFERSYQDQTRGKSDNFVAVIYRPDGEVIRADGQGMAKLVEQHGSKAIEYNNGKWSENVDPKLFGTDGSDIERSVEIATNTPKAPKKGATPQLHGKSKVRQQKEQLYNLLGANEQKTTDGNTLTETGHNNRQAAVSDFEQKRQATLGKARNKKERSQRARNLGPEADAVGRKFAETGGDSVPEYYDSVTDHNSATMNSGGTPLNNQTAKTLDQYEHMPLVIRLDWDGQSGGSGASNTPTPTPMPAPKSVTTTTQTTSVAMQDTMRQRMLRSITNYHAAVVQPTVKAVKEEVLEGGADTLKDIPTSNNLDGSDVVNGYGHQGAGGVTGAGTGMGVQAVHNLFSTGAVDEQGTAVMEKDKQGNPTDQQKQVSYKDRMLGMTGFAGLDAAGNSQHGKGLEEMQQREAEELDARLVQFEQDYVSASGGLKAPPTAQEQVAHDASADWQLYDQEIQSLQARSAEVDPLKAEADQTSQLLESEQSAVDQMKPQLETHKTELDEKKGKQEEADKGQSNLQTEGAAITGSAEKVLGPLGGFIAPFQRMAGMIPTKISSSGARASRGANQMQSGFSDANASGSETTAAATEGKAMVAEMKGSTEVASTTTSKAEGDIGTIEANVHADIAETDQGKVELDDAKNQADSRIVDLESRKATAQSTHSGAVSTMSSWASEHQGARTGHKGAGDQELADIEAEVKKLEGKGGPTGTAFASMAGPMPSESVANLDAGLFAGGFALPGSVSDKMASAFGEDFSDVRIHTGSLASEAASGFNAQAFNFGSHIIFGSGQYRPGTTDGDSLLAHELTHVVQQPSHGIRQGSAGVRLERPGASLEKEASQVASVMKNAAGSSLEGIAKRAMRGGKLKN